MTSTPSIRFDSALYLGMRHPAGALRPWAQLTPGVPAALEPAPDGRRLARRLERLQGCEAATVVPSTLHLFWDLFAILAGHRGVIYVDDEAYPIARWGVERAVARGARMRTFPHHDARALARAMRGDAPHRSPPIVLADGVCGECGRPAPAPAYLDAVQVHGGSLVLDDTQALGLFGAGPTPAAPYGHGGGGSLRWHALRSPRVVVGASLAKAFGVPLAVLGGDAAVTRRFAAASETLVHSSPPSAAALSAGHRALDLNERCGDSLRCRLARLVRRFQVRLAQLGIGCEGGLFPIQTPSLPATVDPAAVHARLGALGIGAALRRGRAGRPCISFLITATHRVADIERAVDALAAAAGRGDARRRLEVAT